MTRALLLLAVAAGTAALARADDMETVRLRTLTAFCWPQGVSAIASTVAAAEAWVAKLNATFYWPDINYDDPNDRADWSTINHLSRTETIVAALTVPGSPVFENATLSAAAHGALAVWLDSHFTNTNWWYSWIGEPLDAGQIFLMLGENRTSAAEQAGLTAISYNAAWWVNQWGGGANLVWMIQAQLYRGLATHNVTAVTQGFDVMWSTVKVQSPSVGGEEGIMPDGVYRFHGTQPLNFAYGADWLSDILQFHGTAAGTQFDLPPAAFDILAVFMAEGDAHMSWGSYWDYSLTGRGIDRPGSGFSVPFSTASIRSIASSTSLPATAAALRHWADSLDGVPGTPPLVGARYFWTSDFLTVHRPTWGASYKAHGDNNVWTVVGGECDNGENMKGEHEGDGVLSVYGDLRAPGAEYVTAAGNPNAVFPLWDWQQLNGITAEHSVPLEACTSGDVWPVKNTAFVGAACDGHYAAFAYDTATHDLTARRSTLFFDGAIIALAANISDPAPVNVRTALASRLLPRTGAGAAVSVGLANGSVIASLPDGPHTWPADAVAWLAAGGNGIVPALQPAAGAVLGVGASNASGDWRSIGAFSGTSVNRLLAAYLDHSGGGNTGVDGGAYAYAVLPAVPAADMPAAAAALAGVDRACIVNGVDVQGAAHPAAGITQVVFWAAGSYTCVSAAVPGWRITVSSSAPAIVLVHTELPGGAVAVSAAHPALSAPDAAAITVSRAVSGAGCSAAGAGATLFAATYPALPDYRGATVNVTCS